MEIVLYIVYVILWIGMGATTARLMKVHSPELLTEKDLETGTIVFFIISWFVLLPLWLIYMTAKHLRDYINS